MVVNTPEMLFGHLADKRTRKVRKKQLIDMIENMGIEYETDLRLKNIRKAMDAAPAELNCEQFTECVAPAFTLIERIYRKDLAIPDWQDFKARIKEIMAKVDKIKDGRPADYIPQLARVSPDKFAVSVVTVSGQQLHLGDVEDRFSLQSVSKPLNYLIAQSLHGDEKVHRHVGREPSGRSFNELAFMKNGLAHNPYINAGAITVVSLLYPDKPLSERYDSVREVYERLAGGLSVGFSNATYLSEKATADRNFALCYHLKEQGAFPDWVSDNASLLSTVEFYFQLCSVEVSSRSLATMASTLANKGNCPMTEIQVFKPAHVRNALSLMLNCGTYDHSGTFAHKVGLPAKSGVSGSMLVIVPGVMGISIWAPPLDEKGNSVKGVAFCEEMTKIFALHMFETERSSKIDPTNPDTRRGDRAVASALYGAARGDVRILRQAFMTGGNMNLRDHDERTLLHLAVTSGNPAAVGFLLDHGANPALMDRWKLHAVDLCNTEAMLREFSKRKLPLGKARKRKGQAPSDADLEEALNQTLEAEGAA